MFGLNAQVINIESKRFFNDTNGFAGRVDANFNATQNTQQIISFGLNVHVQYRKNKHRVLTISDLAFVKAGNNDFVNAGYQHLRYNYKLLSFLTLEAFTQAQYNRILLLDRRYLFGIGPRFKLIKKERFKMYSACLYMYEYQVQDNETLFKNNHRLSAYLTFNINFGRMEFSSTTFYQPNLVDFSDYRIANNSVFEIIVTRHLNFKADLNLLFDTRQPAKIPALVYTLRGGVSFKF